MVKNTQRRGAQNKEKVPPKCISKKECGKVARSRLLKNEENKKRKPLLYDRIKELLHQPSLECPICLQTILKPALAECGHIFCLSCAEDLAQNDYACGICHDYQPTYDLSIDKTFQQLLNVYLTKCSSDERLIYEQRQKALQEKESIRRIGKLATGDYVDFWCLQEKCWKCGVVKDISVQGQVLLAEPKGSKVVQINILSRRLAKHRYYTKEEVVIIDGFVNLSNSVQNGFQRAINPPAVYGMPLFFNIFGNQDQNTNFGGFEGSDFFGFMPRFRQFPF